MKRMRAIHQTMTFEEFERTVPVRPGWKREYYGGMAHIRPSWSMAIFEIDPRTVRGEGVRGLREIRVEDRAPLERAFTDAFSWSPEYCEYDDNGYEKQVKKYFDGFFGTERSIWSPCSQVILDGGEVVAAALFKTGENWPILDCVFARTDRQRRGLASAAARGGMQEIGRQGHGRLRTCAMLCNPGSLAWHASVGFVELPSLRVAQSRFFCASYELKRLKDFDLLTPDTEEQLKETLEHWRKEYTRFDEAKKEDFDTVFPRLEE